MKGHKQRDWPGEMEIALPATEHGGPDKAGHKRDAPAYAASRVVTPSPPRDHASQYDYGEHEKETHCQDRIRHDEPLPIPDGCGQIKRILGLNPQHPQRHIKVRPLWNILRREPTGSLLRRDALRLPQKDARGTALITHKQSAAAQHGYGPADFPRQHRNASQLFVGVTFGPGQNQLARVIEQNQLAIGDDHRRMTDWCMRFTGRWRARLLELPSLTRIALSPKHVAGREVHAGERPARRTMCLGLGLAEIKSE